MDNLPPQSPPAITQGTHQEAADAIGRLIDAQQWLVQQQLQLPKIPDSANADARDPFLVALTTFWNAPSIPSPGAEAVPRSTAFAARLAQVMSDEATLRHRDGTLSERAMRLALSFSRSGAEGMAAEVHARELDMGRIAYAGAVVLTDDREPDMALLYMPARGWDEFASLEALHRFTEERIREEMSEGDTFAGITQDDLESVTGQALISSQAFEGNAFDAIVSRIVEVQKEHALVAWEGVEATGSDEAAREFLEAGVPAAIGLHDHLDVSALMLSRNTRLAQKLSEERLTPLPMEARKAWRASMADYAEALMTAEETRATFHIGGVAPLNEHAASLLQTRLATLGIEDKADDIAIEVYPMPNLDTPASTLDALVNGVEPPETGVLERITLTDLALRNIGMLDRRTFRALGADGRRLAPALNHAAIKTMIREVDVGHRYPAYLRDALSTSPEGQLRRVVATTLQRERMRFEAADARIGTYRTDEPASFLDHHAERGYAWVQAILDAPSPGGRRTVDGHPLVVRQLTYKGVPVKDVLVIGVRSGGSVARVVLYTPDAPDGRHFREFTDRQQAARQFLYAHDFESYLLDRLPREFASVASNGERHFGLSDGNRRAHWALAGGSASYVRTDEPFDEQTVDDNFLDTSYDTALSLMTRDLQAVARSTYHADVDNVSPRIDGESVARGIAHLIGRPFSAGWRTYDRVREGDHGNAFVDLTAAYLASLDFLAVGTMKPLLMRSLAVRTTPQSTQLVATRRPWRDPASLFDERFVARDVSIREARSVKDGVFSIKGGHYIQKDGTLYGVRREGESWRLSHPDSATYAPFISRRADGRWEPLGLMGGAPPGIARALRNTSPGPRLSQWQLLVAAHALRADVGIHEMVRIVLAQRVRGTAALTPAQHDALFRAYGRGRAAPLARPRLPPPVQAPSLPGMPTAPIQPALHPRHPELHAQIRNALVRTNLGQAQQLSMVDHLVAAAGIEEARHIGTQLANRTIDSRVLLTERQMTLWNNAVRAAHRGRPVPPPTSALGAAPVDPLDLTVRPGPGPLDLTATHVERLDPANWPDELWYYTTNPGRGTNFFRTRQPNAEYDLDGLTAWTEGPEAFAARGGAPGPEWVRFDLRRLRDRMRLENAPGSYRVTLIRDAAGSRYVIEDAGAHWFRVNAGEFTRSTGARGALADNAIAGPSWLARPPR